MIYEYRWVLLRVRPWYIFLYILRCGFMCGPQVLESLLRSLLLRWSSLRINCWSLFWTGCWIVSVLFLLLRYLVLYVSSMSWELVPSIEQLILLMLLSLSAHYYPTTFRYFILCLAVCRLLDIIWNSHLMISLSLFPIS